MIGMLVGRVESVDARTALLLVNGVGYETYLPSSDLASLHEGQEVRVYTSLQVSQDALTLYGFTTLAAKRIFLRVQKVSGIGPKVALSLLSTLNVDRFVQAIADGDVASLSSAPGLGKKGAQKIILELKGSLDMSQLEDVSFAASSNAGFSADASVQSIIDGLVSLGWKYHDAQMAVQEVCKNNGLSSPISQEDMPKVLRMALHTLDRGR